MTVLEKVAQQVKGMLISRANHAADTVVSCGGCAVGGGAFQIIAGPCSVESAEGVMTIAKAVKAAGATMLRGGVFKPRTSPYSFQGLGADGMKALVQAGRETGLPIVTELMSERHLEAFNDVDVIQIGARNMHNYDLLKELGAHWKKPILLKRGFASTVFELLASAEYLLSAGNSQVILCERGIRAFDTVTRNVADLGAVAALRRLTHLPIIVDPSHATGVTDLVAPVAVAATAIGADGLIVEVHDHPEKALSDGEQSLTPEAFAGLVKKVCAVRPFACT